MKHSVAWSFDRRALYLTDDTEDQHVVTVRFDGDALRLNPQEKLRLLRIMVATVDRNVQPEGE